MPTRSRRAVSATSALSLVISAFAFVAAASVTALAGGVALASPASADVPSTGPVSGDALPTVQINGVVWRQAIAGNVAFAGGEFTNARPAGSAPGVNTVPRTNLLAYDIRTGVLIDSFNPVLNGKVNDLTVTPDGTKLIVGGQFTTINGLNRYRVAIFNLSGTNTNTPSITLSTFAPSVDGSVYGVAASNSTVFVGGQFAVAGKQDRPRFAAFAISNSALMPIRIPVDDGAVKSLVVNSDGSQVVLAGNFSSVGGSNNPGFGMYRADSVTGAPLPLPVNNEVRNAGPNAAILHVATDGTYFYGGAYKYFASGAMYNSEGTFQAKWSDGSLVTLEDCHGDTYDIAPVGDLVYKASHKHYCGNSGGFPQTDPWTRWDATAWTKTVEGTNIKDAYGYADHPGTPRPGIAPFFPRADVGTYTGKGQSVWTVTGNSQYVLYGGEFPTVNGVDQQGLVRFATRSIAPNKQAPRTTDTSTFAVSARSLEPGKVRVMWPTLWDRDDATLQYDLYRDGTLIKSFTATAYQWNGYQMSYDDTGLLPGSIPSYQVRVSDPTGNKNNSTTATVTVAGSDSVGTYASKVLADGADKYWRLDESDNSVNDLGGSDNTTTSGSTVTRNASGALLNSTDTASNFDGTNSGRIYSAQGTTTTSNMSEELWFKTTSTSGKLAGYGNVATGNSALYDRHIYMSGGKVYFGVTTTSNVSISSPKTTYADGKWHQVVATLGSHGMALYLDGALVASNSAATYGRPYPAWFRIGGDNSWLGNPNFKGQLDEVSTYPKELTAQQVDDHWVASGRTSTNPVNVPPVASFTATPTNLNVAVDGSASTDIDGSVSSYSWDWGDGTAPGTGVTTNHTYASAGTYTIKLTVTDNKGATGFTTKSVQVTAPANANPTASFTTTLTKLHLAVDGSGSSDPDGTVASYAWDWGDGTPTDSGVTATHDYANAGTYTVKLTVTDNQGATGFTTKSVQPTANVKPTAAFTTNVTDMHVATNGSGSSDSDGSIASYSWDWGDGSPTDSGATASHDYTTQGSYTVKLTVTDNDGATDFITHGVSVGPHVNANPTASFTTTQSQLTVNTDGTGSNDSDGTVQSYAWDWGDGSPADNGVTSSHTYAAAGPYTITLTVTDNDGGTGQATKSVTVASTTVLASDDFNRTVAPGGWGTATKGGAWTVAGTKTQYSVAPGAAKINIPTSGRPLADLKSISTTDTDTTVEFSVDKIIASTYVGINGRTVSGGAFYNARIKIAADGTVQLYILDTSTALGAAYNVPGLVITPGTHYKLRFAAKGTTTPSLTAKVWKASDLEPSAWQVTRTDSSPLSGPGYVGLYTYIPGSGPENTTFYSYLVTDGN